MKEYIFLGAERTGKTSCMLILAKILASLGKKILVIDTTKSRGVHSFFDYNDNVECSNSFNEIRPNFRENFEILCNNPESDIENINLEKIYKKLNVKNYDLVFIEADENIDKSLISTSTKIFFFQDSDKHTLAKNKKILKELHITLDKIVIIFNNMLDIKYDVLYLMNDLVPLIEHREFAIVNETTSQYTIEIYFEEQNIANLLECKIDGHLSLKGFSDEFKASIYEFVNLIEEIDSKEYAKIVR